MSDSVFMIASAAMVAFLFVVWCFLKVGADSDER